MTQNDDEDDEDDEDDKDEEDGEDEERTQHSRVVKTCTVEKGYQGINCTMDGLKITK